ncbi:cytochrome P450 302a1, mitochondrial-like [Gigantopelta aegis]|uniref:cytochrome P450 302a1, mitochondrial-like n=1 Tax=Gigantopelta aegis TaxID=1735272 RepID=UPI001B88D7CF|nr:cytochrome P450 302a1, mitochondrial-like [Gigantopelta aegis]
MKITTDIVRQAVFGTIRRPLVRQIHVDSLDPLETELELEHVPNNLRTKSSKNVDTAQTAAKDTAKALRDLESDRIRRKVSNIANRKIPGPPSIPLLGALWQYLPGGRYYGIDLNEAIKSNHARYGDIIKEEIVPGFTLVRMFNPSMFSDVYKAEGDNPERALFSLLKRYNDVRNDGVQGLLTSQGESWRRLRREVQQRLLPPKTVELYLDEQGEVADDFVQRITEVRDQEGRVHDFLPEIYKYASEAVGTVCFNQRLGLFGKNADQHNDFQQAVHTCLELTQKELSMIPLFKVMDTSLFRRFAEAQDTIRREALSSMDKAMKEIPGADADKESMNLIHYLITASKLTFQEIFTFISELFSAGVDTTGNFMAFSLHALAKHQNVQKELQREIADVTSGRSTITAEMLREMSYLRGFLKETLRMYPVAPGLGRTLAKDTSFQGYSIPAGTNVVLQCDMTGRDPRFVNEPHVLKPERWMRENGKEPISPYLTIPFGHGPRSCPGRRLALQEVSLGIIKILQQYSLGKKDRDLSISMKLLNTPSEPLSFEFIRRRD